MSKREKILALGVLLVVVLGVGQYLWTGIQAGFNAKYDTIDSLTNKSIQEGETITRSLFARKDLNKYAARSLPSNLEKARTVYTEWLIEFAAESNVRNFKHQSTNGVAVQINSNQKQPQNIYRTIKYTFDGEANLVDATRMLYRFYEKPYLHRISSMKLTPASSEYGLFIVNMTIEVAVLDAAAADQASPAIEEFKMMTRPVEEYVAAISSRNIFYPANRPPAWSRTASASATQNAPFSYDLTANDPDEGQQVKYELVDSNAPGIQVRDGRLVWSPRTLGKYEVKVKAIDTGIPQAVSVQTIAINVVEPPPPPTPPTPEPKFDIATQTRVTALLSGREGPQAWFTSRIEGKSISVKVGDKFDLAGISGEVTAIGSNYVELKSDGKRWTIGQDESLADAYRRGQED